jgi:hypothetical protein
VVREAVLPQTLLVVLVRQVILQLQAHHKEILVVVILLMGHHLEVVVVEVHLLPEETVKLPA